MKPVRQKAPAKAAQAVLQMPEETAFEEIFETYRGAPKLSTQLRELPWSSHLHILSRAKRPEEREFYLRMASSRSLSPAMVAEYRIALPDKKLLQAKLREFYQLLAPEAIAEPPASKPRKPNSRTTNPSATGSPEPSST